MAGGVASVVIPGCSRGGVPAVVGAAIAIALATGVLAGCGSGDAEPRASQVAAPPRAAAPARPSDPAPDATAGARGAGPGGPGDANRALKVSTSPVILRDVGSTVEALGSVEAEEEVQVVAGVDGVVTRVRFREGDTVTPDTLLAEIDPERYRLMADRARANLDKTVAQERQAESDLRRREELLHQQPPLVADEEVERARQEAERLKAAVAEARAAWELAEQDRARSVVRPLVPGIINRKSVVTGQHVESKAVLASLMDTRRLQLRFRVSEQESVRLRVGQAVTFRTAAWPDRRFAATVFHVSSSADPQSRQVEVLARVEDVGALKPGFFAEVAAPVDARRDAILVPERAVLATEQGFVVFEVLDGVARKRPVTVGLRTRDGDVEILGGLDRRAIVVTDGGSILTDGARVETSGPSS